MCVVCEVYVNHAHAKVLIIILIYRCAWFAWFESKIGKNLFHPISGRGYFLGGWWFFFLYYKSRTSRTSRTMPMVAAFFMCVVCRDGRIRRTKLAPPAD